MNQLSSKDWVLIKQRLTPYLFLLPALLILGLTVFWPALQAFYLSFTSYEDISQPPQWIGIANFLKLWKDAVFWQTLTNTFLYLVGVVPILVIAPLGLAILVNQKLRGMNWFRAAYYTPVVISMIVAGIAWKWLYAENGLLNQFFKALGMFPEGIPWLTSPNKIFGILPISLASVMAVTIWKGLGYYMVIYLAGLQSIPGDVYEAAAIDGSDGIRKHLDITIPLMKPYLALVAVISAISATKVFEEVYIMTQGGPLNSSKTIVYYLYEQAFTNLEISYACTIGLVLFLIILGLSILRLIISRESTDNIKL
ncbi:MULTISPECIES: carbohydrate ABC transporter permease [unclassified Tolypothrix]|uniref:carbohydrate ABC transporter permease n=1 Tax=unclassified Tolypothrix TaxID=2649714 RepID=UPI0005EAB5E2|nr:MULTISPECIES: sugar ABC transporter permease [unclassified Tolypothrix]BAY89615.1 binding-protein-dependent transport systems inner membrane component [Microchaete diplosiphon NIES-3275]EKF02602.1 putative transmembrane permease MsmF [Tolypothrix sp. PCC 7601]MBE9084765.1 sugar ABC transporter permease [Tolypothrix sp. LEGE 11397]UYD23886.1 sugar ABC transporter permease [Tolypothrix sp. PCC 7712]UYD33889.1 sugar ABC transporter permease [Tolypothrix sp. PCC 7601]